MDGLDLTLGEERDSPERAAEPDRSAARRWTSGRSQSVGRSVGGALLLELALVGGLLVFLGERTVQPAVAQRVAVRVVQPVPPKPVPQFPTQVSAPEMPVVTAMPVTAQSLPIPQALPSLTVPPAATPPNAAASGAPTVDPVAAYTAELNAAVQSGLRVTGMVRAMRLHGVATVLFELTPSGHLLWAKLARTSGIPPIDDAAVGRVRATNYPSFPANLPQQDMTFEIEVKLNADR